MSAVMQGGDVVRIAVARELFLDELASEELDALSAVLPRVRAHMRATVLAPPKRPR